MSRTATVEAPVTMDYPQAKEIITSPHYTFRFDPSPETESVEVSIDDGPWQACRKSGQYFWFDWTGFASGHHAIVARGVLADGGTEETRPRVARVQREQKAQ